jgi:predicted RND superfamily exporter protein
VAIFVVFLALFRSPWIAGLAMVPNVLPILVTLGVMATLRVPLDVVTVMVASINLGLVVDDTTHLLHGFRERMAEGESLDDAIAGTLAATGRAIVFTAVMLSLGFGVLALSDFRPTARFGGLTAFTLVLALFVDLLLTPTLVRWARPVFVPRAPRAVVEA